MSLLPDEPLEQAMMLQSLVIARGTTGDFDESDYRALRKNLLSNDSVSALVPRVIKTSRDGGSLLSYLTQIASGGGSWGARRRQVYEEFRPLLDALEGRALSPVDHAISGSITSYDGEGVRLAWERALSRREVDPEGAITAARTFLEDICKHILEDVGKDWDKSWKLPKLYNETAKVLNLAPSQHDEETFKRILGGCSRIIQGLGELRNNLSDSHGGGRRRVRPTTRHAAFAVNLAGSTGMFLIQTWLERGQVGKPENIK